MNRKWKILNAIAGVFFNIGMVFTNLRDLFGDTEDGLGYAETIFIDGSFDLSDSTMLTLDAFERLFMEFIETNNCYFTGIIVPR